MEQRKDSGQVSHPIRGGKSRGKSPSPPRAVVKVTSEMNSNKTTDYIPNEDYPT